MSEKDPYSNKKKNVESEMNSRMNDNTNPDLQSRSTRKPEDDINPVRPKTSMPDNKNRNPDQSTDDKTM